MMSRSRFQGTEVTIVTGAFSARLGQRYGLTEGGGGVSGRGYGGAGYGGMG